MLSSARLEELRKFGTGELMPGGGPNREAVYRQCITDLVETVKWQRSEWNRTISRLESSVSAAENLTRVLQGHLDSSKADRKDAGV